MRNDLVRSCPDYSSIQHLFDDGKIIEYMIAREGLKKERKEIRYRVCTRCDKKKLIKYFTGESKYCNKCKGIKKIQGRIKVRESTKRYLKSEKGRVYKRNKNSRRRARKRACEVSATTKQIRKVLENQNNLCNYCKCELDEKNRHLDHIKPLSKGGEHSVENLQRLCAKCNIKKSDIYPYEHND